MKKEVCDCKIIQNTQLNHDNFLIKLQPSSKLQIIQPGQFVNIQVKNTSTTFLRRPFSIHDVDYERNTFSILVKTVGNGTHKISEIVPGDSLSVIFPLGNGFTRATAKDRVLLVGGGVGIAPMLILAKELQKACAQVHILLGAQSKSDHILLDVFKKHGSLYLSTDDGSLGTKGFVTDHEIFSSLQNIDKIYCCGPEPMMKAVAAKANQSNTFCEVSLENTMACGFGVCLCCVTKTKSGNECVCTSGPVFNINNLEWQI